MAKESAEQKLLKIMGKNSGEKMSAPSAVFKAKPKLALTVGTLNQIFIFAILACIVFLALEMRSGVFLLNSSLDFGQDAGKSVSVVEPAEGVPAVKSLSYYMDKIGLRNIFKPFESQVSVKPMAVQNLAKRLAKYKLVGIAWLDLPESASVMIEDTEKKDMYFLKKGEKIEDVTVKTIYTDRVVFSCENEETTIKL